MRVCIQFDECKPHWAKERDYPQRIRDLGATNLNVTGDFDAKITMIYADVFDFEAFLRNFENNLLGEIGSLHRVLSAE